MKIHINLLLGAELFRADGRRDMTKVSRIVVFLNFLNAPESALKAKYFMLSLFLVFVFKARNMCVMNLTRDICTLYFLIQVQ
jgi:hypothetical protein